MVMLKCRKVVQPAVILVGNIFNGELSAVSQAKISKFNEVKATKHPHVVIEQGWFKCLSTSWNALATISHNNPGKEMAATYCRYSGKTVPKRSLSPKNNLLQSISKWESKFLICLMITYCCNTKFTMIKIMVIKLTLDISLPTIRDQMSHIGSQWKPIIPAGSKFFMWFEGQTCRKEIILFSVIS